MLGLSLSRRIKASFIAHRHRYTVQLQQIIHIYIYLLLFDILYIHVYVNRYFQPMVSWFCQMLVGFAKILIDPGVDDIGVSHLNWRKKNPQRWVSPCLPRWPVRPGTGLVTGFKGWWSRNANVKRNAVLTKNLTKWTGQVEPPQKWIPDFFVKQIWPPASLRKKQVNLRNLRLPSSRNKGSIRWCISLNPLEGSIHTPCKGALSSTLIS